MCKGDSFRPVSEGDAFVAALEMGWILWEWVLPPRRARFAPACSLGVRSRR